MKEKPPERTDPRRFLPPDETLPLSPMLDVAFVRSVLEAQGAQGAPENIIECRIGHIRYSPGVSCTVCYHVTHGEEGGGRARASVLYAKCLAAERYGEVESKTARRRWLVGALCRSPVRVPQCQSIIYEFPNDARIAGLRVLGEPGGLDRIVADQRRAFVGNGWEPADRPVTCTPLRYKPESRFVARCDTHWVDGHEERTKTVVLRFESSLTSNSAFDLVQRLRAAFEGDSRIGFSKPLFCSIDRGLIAVESVQGDKLSEILRTGEAGSALERTARGLALLHTYRDSKLPVYTTRFHLSRAKQTARLLANCGEEIFERADEVLQRLSALGRSSGAGQIGFVHGDFHQGQVLCHEGTTQIIDLDRAYMGETAADIGSFLAQLEVLQLRERLPRDAGWGESFLESYERASGETVSPDRLKFYTAVALFELAGREFRRLKHRWPDRVEAVLDRCRSILET